MAVVDHEKVLQDLEDHLSTKRSHGADELLLKIAALRKENRIEEGLPERALRLYGTDLFGILQETIASEPASQDSD